MCFAAGNVVRGFRMGHIEIMLVRVILFLLNVILSIDHHQPMLKKSSEIVDHEVFMVEQFALVPF